MSALQPGYLRVGGTLADRLLFKTDNQSSFHLHNTDESNLMKTVKPNFTLTGKH